MEDDKRRPWKMEKQLYDAFLKASCVSSSCNNWTGSHTVKATQIYFLPDHPKPCSNTVENVEERWWEDSQAGIPYVAREAYLLQLPSTIQKHARYVYCRGVSRWCVSSDGLLVCTGCVWLLMLTPELLQLWLEISSNIMCDALVLMLVESWATSHFCSFLCSRPIYCTS